MQNHDEQMERHLKKFRPRPVRRLEVPRQMGSPLVRRLAAAAVLVFAVTVSLWYAHRTTPIPPKTATFQDTGFIRNARQTRMNTLALTKFAFDDSAAFDALMIDESRAMLPDVNGQQGALLALAKE